MQVCRFFWNCETEGLLHNEDIRDISHWKLKQTILLIWLFCTFSTLVKCTPAVVCVVLCLVWRNVFLFCSIISTHLTVEILWVIALPSLPPLLSSSHLSLSYVLRGREKETGRSHISQMESIPRTCWRDYIFHLAWEQLTIPQEEMEDVAGGKYV